MKKLLFLLTLSIALIGCQKDKTINTQGTKYAVIRNANINLKAKEPKILVEVYDKDGNYLDGQEYDGYIFNSIENEKEILLYGESDYTLRYDKEKNEFSNLDTKDGIDYIAMHKDKYLTLNNAGYQNANNYNSRIVLYNSEKQEINRMSLLKMPYQIINMQLTDEEIITFSTDLSRENSSYILNVYDKNNNKELYSKNLGKINELKVTLQHNNNVYYLTDQGLKDIKPETNYVLPDEINQILNTDGYVADFCVIDDYWYMILNQLEMNKTNIYKLKLENTQLEIIDKITKDCNVLSNHRNSNGDFIFGYEDDDGGISFFKISSNDMKEIKIPVKKVDRKKDHYNYISIIELTTN